MDQNLNIQGKTKTLKSIGISLHDPGLGNSVSNTTSNERTKSIHWIS